jgi:hypothetical protein
MMNNRRWISITLITISALACLNFVVDYIADPYGLLRDSHGRKLGIYFAERKAKFLMNKRYVPSNFDGLVIGPSSAVNWDLASMPGVSMYNDSLSGGNGTEAKRIVDQALRSGHFKLAICIIHPTMLSSHFVLDGLDTVTSAEALGSIHVLVHEAAVVLLAMHIKFGKNNPPNGSTALPENKSFGIQVFPAESFDIDPIALNDYRSLIQSLREHGAQIVYVVPPLYEPCLDLNGVSFATYVEKVRSMLPPAPLIDLDDPEYKSFRSDSDNYVNCSHLDAQGAREIDGALAKLVPQAISSFQ